MCKKILLTLVTLVGLWPLGYSLIAGIVEFDIGYLFLMPLLYSPALIPNLILVIFGWVIYFLNKKLLKQELKYFFLVLLMVIEIIIYVLVDPIPYT